MYRPMESPAYCAVFLAGRDGYWIVEDGWTRKSLAAGPFRAADTLRALRLANTFVPEGCERGPWRPGLHLFEVQELAAGDWTRAEEAWLEPSQTEYAPHDFSECTNERCCSPALTFPRVEGKGEGRLVRAWNAHPAGSLIESASESLERGFVVVDAPHGLR